MSVEASWLTSFTNVEDLRTFLQRPTPPEDLERRRKLFDETLALRKAIGLIDLSVEELLKEEDD